MPSGAPAPTLKLERASLGADTMSSHAAAAVLQSASAILAAALLLLAAEARAQPQAMPLPPPPPPVCQRPASCTVEPCSTSPWFTECRIHHERCENDYCDEAHDRCWARCVKKVRPAAGWV